jgi:Xaa-Pro aminopeptidase
MKSDLDALMQARHLDAILVLGNSENNPPMYYLTGGGRISNAVLIKKIYEPPVLFCNSMEREEAEKSGFKVIALKNEGMKELAKRPKELLADCGFTSGTLGVYGQTEISMALHIFDRLGEELPDIKLIGEEQDQTIFLYAMETKDENELERIRRMGKTTTEVVGLVAEYLTSREVGADEVLLKADGIPLTIGDVKNKIALWLAERGAVDTEGLIFAIGRDAGIPHSVGNPDDFVRLGQTIIFDIFPSEAGGGYYYDFTRTWCLGYAPPEAQKLFDEVKDIYEKVIENIDLNVVFKQYQKVVCDEFHKNGHKTPMHDDGVLMDGYVHSLGHGVGLNVHERPHSSHTSLDDNLLKPGVVITLEPGLYYPEKGMGARIEDTYWIRPDGIIERLAEYPYDFVLPMKKWKKKN